MHSLPAGGPSADGSGRWDGGGAPRPYPVAPHPSLRQGPSFPIYPLTGQRRWGWRQWCVCSPRPGGPPWVPGTVIKALRLSLLGKGFVQTQRQVQGLGQLPGWGLPKVAINFLAGDLPAKVCRPPRLGCGRPRRVSRSPPRAAWRPAGPWLDRPSGRGWLSACAPARADTAPPSGSFVSKDSLGEVNRHPVRLVRAAGILSQGCLGTCPGPWTPPPSAPSHS